MLEGQLTTEGTSGLSFERVSFRRSTVAVMVAVVEHRGWLTTALQGTDIPGLRSSVFRSRAADGQAKSRTVCLLAACRFAA